MNAVETIIQRSFELVLGCCADLPPDECCKRCAVLAELSVALRAVDTERAEMARRAIGHAYVAGMAEGGEAIVQQELERERKDHAETLAELRRVEAERDSDRRMLDEWKANAPHPGALAEVESRLIDTELALHDARDNARKMAITLLEKEEALQRESERSFAWRKALQGCDFRELPDDPTAAAEMVADYITGFIREVVDLKLRIDRVGALLSENGCDCECNHPHTDHDDDCDRCLACRVGDAIGGAR